MKLKLWLTTIVILTCLTLQAQEVKSPKFGKGLFNLVGQDSSWTMKIGARVQILTLASWINEDGKLVDPYSNFLVRRARLKFNGYAFTPKLKYKIELGLSNRDMSGASIFTSNSPRYILDAVMKWNFYENFVLWFGQTKLPGNRERVISSANMQFVDRSVLNSGFNIDRDIGMQLRHHTKISDNFIIREIFAFSQGEGRNVTTGNLGGFQYTGRIEFLPFGNFKSKGDYFGSDLSREVKPKLSVGVSYDYNNDAVRTRSNRGLYMITDDGFHETNISTLFIDAMYKYKGFSFMGEYAWRDAKDPFAKNSDGTLTGAIVQVGHAINTQAGYLFKSNWEVAARYSNLEYDKNITGRDMINEYTLGVSKYLVGHSLKVQSDFTYIDVINGNGGLSYRLQFDIHF